MSIISEWYSTLKQVFSSAGQFYENETDTSIGGKPLRIAFISLFLSGIISAISTLLVVPGEMQLLALLDVVLAPIFGIVGLAFTAALTHLVGMLIGFENGYSETFAVFAYASVISPIAALVSFIPIAGIFLAIAVGLFSIYVQIKGIQKFQQVSIGKAAVAVLLPVLIIIGIIIALIVLFSAALVALMGSTPAPPM